MAQALLAGLATGVLALWLLQHLQAAQWLAAPWQGWLASPLPIAGVEAAAAAGDAAAWHQGALAAGIALALSMAAALMAWRTSAHAPLDFAWDGQAWQVDGQPAVPQLMLDLGAVLVLRWQVRAQQEQRDQRAWRWTAITRADTGPAWHALRVALHAHRPADREAPPAWP